MHSFKSYTACMHSFKTAAILHPCRWFKPGYSTTLQMKAKEAMLLYRGMRLYMFFLAAGAMVYVLNTTVQLAVAKLGVDAATCKSQLQLLNTFSVSIGALLTLAA